MGNGSLARRGAYRVPGPRSTLPAHLKFTALRLKLPIPVRIIRVNRTPSGRRPVLLAGLALVVVAFLVQLYFSHSDATPVAVRQDRILMGTVWSLQVLPDGQSRETTEEALDAAFIEVDRIDRLMSEWKPDSPVSAINTAAGAQGAEVPTELVEIIRRSIRFGELTDGAFDITWRGMGNLWHFDESFSPPSEAQVEEAKARVDYRRIRIDGNRVSLPEGWAIGLGGIAKGYAIDRAAGKLREAGFRDFLVNGGGDVLAAGMKGDRNWTVGVRAPRGGPQDLVARIRATGAVVTSGDYERFRIVDGVRYHHIIDPRTGRPAGLCRSVTIVAGQAELADVLATSVFVLGPERGLKLISTMPHVEAFIIDANGKHWLSDGFRKVADFASE